MTNIRWLSPGFIATASVMREACVMQQPLWVSLVSGVHQCIQCISYFFSKSCLNIIRSKSPYGILIRYIFCRYIWYIICKFGGDLCVRMCMLPDILRICDPSWSIVVWSSNGQVAHCLMAWRFTWMTAWSLSLGLDLHGRLNQAERSTLIYTGDWIGVVHRGTPSDKA